MYIYIMHHVQYYNVCVNLQLTFVLYVHNPLSGYRRYGDQMVSALDPDSSSPGSRTDQGHCVVLGQDTMYFTLTVPLSIQVIDCQTQYYSTTPTNRLLTSCCNLEW